MIMHRGRIVAEDTTEGLTERLQAACGAHLLALVREDTPGVAGVPGVAAVEPGTTRTTSFASPEDPRAALAALAVGQGWGLEMRIAALSLRVFIRSPPTTPPRSL